MESAGSSPLLNKYKLDLVLRRIPQTLMGGMKIKIGFDAPLYAYINQLVLWLMPAFLACIFTVVAELDRDLEYIAAYVYGSCMFCFTIVSLGIATIIRWKSRKKSVKQQQNILAEDDEVDFTSCFGIETVNFVMQKKRHAFNLLFHASVSGVCSGLLFLYIMPSRTEILFGKLGYSVVYYILSWMIVCTGHYPIIGQMPPEPAQYSSGSMLELNSVTRIVHLALFAVVGAIARFYSSLEPADYILHIIFLLVPTLWMLGMLPPLTALLSWSTDQTMVFLFGGSSMATDVRAFVMLMLSLASSGIIYGFEDTTAGLIAAALLGFLVSLDLCTCLEFAVHSIANFPVMKQISVCKLLRLSLPSNIRRSIAYPIKSKQGLILAFIVMFLAGANVSIVAIIQTQLTDVSKRDSIDPLCFTLIVCTCMHVIAADLHAVFIFFSIIRNPLFATYMDVQNVSKGKVIIQLILYNINRIFAHFVIPLLLSAIITVNNVNKSPSFFDAVLTLRAFRWVWQETFLSSVDVIVVFIIQKASMSWAWWNLQSYFLQLFLVSLLRDRAEQCLKKFYFTMLLTYRFYFSSKQRHEHWRIILTITCLCSPILLLLFCHAVAFSCPLLPLFTLPLIIAGFPRPNRFWPDPTISSKSSSSDWIYYESLTPDLAAGISQSLCFGSLANVRNGDFYLARFQDRLVILSILEKGMFHVNFTLKGLELQETSCHTAEAANIDDLFDAAFISDKEAEKAWYNTSINHVLTPCDVIWIQTYSDAKNVLTGIIEQTDTLTKVDEFFIKTLTWLLVRYCWRRRKEGPPKKYPPEVRRSHTSTSITTKVTFVEGLEESKPQAWRSGSPCNASHSDSSTFSKGSSASQSSDRSLIRDSNPQAGLKQEGNGLKHTGITTGFPAADSWTAMKGGKQSLTQTGPRLLEDDDDDFDDFGFDDDEFDIPKKITIGSKLSGTGNKSLQDLSDDNEMQNAFAWNDGKSSLTQSNNPPSIQCIEGTVISNRPLSKAEKRPSSAVPALSSVHSKLLEPPSHWTSRIPVEQTNINKVLDRFQNDWYNTVLSTITFNPESLNALESICSDQGLLTQFRNLVLSCYYLIQIAGLYGAPLGPSHVYETFCGAVAWSHDSKWLEEDEELKDIVIKAYRYAFKLAYDEMVVGEIENDEELRDSLNTFDESWYMGPDSKDEWSQAVLEKKPFLFDIGRNKENGTFTSRTLTMQNTAIPFGKLNTECVRGLWASLALELLYFTNDDEERYSIQAHPHLLRNITVQAADPPLGYPVYSSGLLKGWGF